MSPANKNMLLYGLAGLGNVAGIVVAVKRKSGFLGGAGWFLLGGLAGAALGYVVVSMIPDQNEQKKVGLDLAADEDTLHIQVNSK